MKNLPDSAEKLAKIVSQLALDAYLREDTNEHKREKREISEKIELVLQSMMNEPQETSKHTTYTLKFIEELWKKYDCKEVADFFKDFARMEPALLSLGGARDHFLHIFHVFLFGLRIISQIISKMGEESKNALKIIDEDEKTCVFSYAYNFKERIFYTWTLASTFHDIGFPLEHLPQIERGIKDFADYCKYDIAPLYFKLDYSDISELDRYLRLMSTLYGGKLAFKKIEKDVWVYEKKEHPYFHKVLISALRERNHGIISSLILFRVIEDIFLFPSQETKYKLTPDSFNRYIEYFYNDDIARVGLIISMHHLKRETLPPMPKIKFSEYPLAFLLILADEFQQFLRKTTDLGQEKIMLKKIPDIDVEIRNNRVTIKIEYELDDSEALEIKKLMKIEDLDGSVKSFWSGSTKILERRLSSEDKYKVLLKIRKDGKLIYDWILPSERG